MAKEYQQYKKKAFQEKKYDSGFPKNAIKYFLKNEGIGLGDLDSFVYYEKPSLTIEGLLKTFIT